MIRKREITVSRSKEITDIIILSSKVYANILNKYVEIDGKRLEFNDKKIISLFHGIANSDNSFSRTLKDLRYSYKINIDVDDPKYEETYSAYYKLFINLLNKFDLTEENAINNIAIYLLDYDVINRIHKGKYEKLEKIKENLIDHKIKTLKRVDNI